MKKKYLIVLFINLVHFNSIFSAARPQPKRGTYAAYLANCEKERAEFHKQIGASLDPGARMIVGQYICATPEQWQKAGELLYDLVEFYPSELEQIIKLLDSSNINYQDKTKFTPLMSAAYNGHVNLVELLLKHGADASLKNVDGETALDSVKGEIAAAEEFTDEEFEKQWGTNKEARLKNLKAIEKLLVDYETKKSSSATHPIAAVPAPAKVAI